ncbi:AAA family ATPase [Salinibacterium sp. NG22]|uniref:BTAD domain-containing putative transcriptional regulator n=1 Tax=Salinibacterium sp. NG22 TaxID=2792040 RepID=UPI0018CF8F7F|nr:BTAD domain-containing putative transcriptional regulator [Salinibacterium sp. NG22]MBH0109167.1 AAA family ATPase [Salinibacterium sp. NG22]
MRFENLREEGGWLLADGGLVQASERLHEALELWRGAAFTDLPESSALQAESARLEKLRASALADRIDIDLALGRESTAIPELAALVEESPLLERHWGQLMTALYRRGHAQEALDVFARARAISTDRLGVEPSGELGQLHVRILQEQPSESLLRLPVATPVLSQITRELGRPPAIGLALSSNDTETLATLVKQHRALIVTGPAGIGKTHLLRAARARFEAQHCLTPFLSASTLSRSIPLGVFAGTAGSFSEGWRTPAALIDSFTRHRSTTVLLVDNVNQLDESSLFVVTQLISTSRVPTIMVARSLTEAPAEIQALYDSGELTEVSVQKLSDGEAYELAVSITGGPLTPDSRLSILDAAAGNPFHVREIIAGSLTDGLLVQTEHGWELRGHPAPSPRLAQLVGARFDGLEDASVEAAALVAIAGEYPGEALGATQRRILVRADVLVLSDGGRWRLKNPLESEVLRARFSKALWNDLTREVVQVLKSDLASDMPRAQLRAHILALDLGDPIDIPATMALAEMALGAFDERLALRAVEAVIMQDPQNVHAYRLAGLAVSALRMVDAADAHFGNAHRYAASEAEITAVALAHAQHSGLRLQDPRSALEIIERALSLVEAPGELAQLHRGRMRWSAVAGTRTGTGMGGEVESPPAITSDVADASGLIIIGVSGVITGPLDEAHRVLAQLHQVPEEIIDLVPGGAALITLTEIMALSNSGDVVAAQHRLRKKIVEASARAPESLGQWEYALGFSELLSGDASQAYTLALSAVEHLEWRDATGLLPAAQALTAASALAAGHPSAESRAMFDGIPAAASSDPKVVMLRVWAEARSAWAEGHREEAAHTLVETAQWLLWAQHTYFAGMLAHCAIRIGCKMDEAVAVLGEAHAIAGGGLLTLLLRHGEANVAGDAIELNEIARDARELGLVATAADTWVSLIAGSGAEGLPDQLKHQRSAVAQLLSEKPALVSWVT